MLTELPFRLCPLITAVKWPSHSDYAVNPVYGLQYAGSHARDREWREKFSIVGSYKYDSTTDPNAAPYRSAHTYTSQLSASGL